MTILLASPHRMPFLAGTVGLCGLALWWLVQLYALHGGGPVPPQTQLPPALLHGPAMIYAGFAPFIFGFLLTVFPRWMGQGDLPPKQFGPVGIALLAGVLTTLAGLWSGFDWLALAGFCLLAAGWAVAIVVLASVLRRNALAARPRCWHARSALGALCFGIAGIAAATGFLASGDPALLALANRIGIGGLLLPIFLTVAHRMVPFFAGNVIADYVRWRPDWLLAALWGLLLTRLAGEMLPFVALAVAANAGLAAVTGLMCWKWWPRTRPPGLLLVLVWGFTWAPPGFAFAAIDGALGLYGRGADHALMIGFAASLLVAMVTRVTQGHSGRPLEMPAVAWIAFGAIQAAAASRIVAGVNAESGSWLIVAIFAFTLGLLPWAMRNGAIYVSPRRDGKDG